MEQHGNCLLLSTYLPFAVCCHIFAAYCLLSTSLLPTVCCHIFAACCLLSHLCCLLSAVYICTVCSLLSAPWCPLSGVLCLLLAPCAVWCACLCCLFLLSVALRLPRTCTHTRVLRYSLSWPVFQTFEEFSRKWNKPVHEYLLRHVYLNLFTDLHWPRFLAVTTTFLYSIILHELVLSMCFGMVRPWLAFFSLSQIPLKPLMQLDFVKGKRLGNLVFWYGQSLGIPLIMVLYSREYCAIPNNCEALQ